MGLPGKIRVKGGACAVADATGGSALDRDLTWLTFAGSRESSCADLRVPGFR
jgi:hypothetical protein